jgi:hypothetical protein
MVPIGLHLQKLHNAQVRRQAFQPSSQIVFIKVSYGCTKPKRARYTAVGFFFPLFTNRGINGAHIFRKDRRSPLFPSVSSLYKVYSSQFPHVCGFLASRIKTSMTIIRLRTERFLLFLTRFVHISRHRVGPYVFSGCNPPPIKARSLLCICSTYVVLVDSHSVCSIKIKLRPTSVIHGPIIEIKEILRRK